MKNDTVNETTREWLAKQCNKRVNGECRTLRCIQRGGSTATCEADEILVEMERMREANANQRGMIEARDRMIRAAGDGTCDRLRAENAELRTALAASERRYNAACQANH